MTTRTGKFASGLLRHPAGPFAASLLAAALLPLLPSDVLRAQSPAPVGPAPDLAAWLEAHPSVAEAITFEDAEGLRHYKDWTREQKDRLRGSFEKAWRGEPSGLADPLPNVLGPLPDGAVRQGLSEADATALYFATAGSCLAFELRHAAPWTITQYRPDELAVLFNSRCMFTRTTPPKDSAGPVVYEIRFGLCGDSLPAPPDVCLAFVQRHGFIGASAVGTVCRLLEWCSGLVHFDYRETPDIMQAHWQYAGFVPVSRVISGTYYDDGKGKKANALKHYTAGCSGTTGFLMSVLRCVNIPVVNRRPAKHSQPCFPTLGEYMAHGDDPYTPVFTTIQPRAAVSRLLMDGARYDELFGAGVAPEKMKANIDALTGGLAMERLPVRLLWFYLEDQRQGKSHAEGLIAKICAAMGSVEQLEALGLWTRMDARIAELGGEGKVRTLNTQLCEAAVNHTPE